MTLYYYEEKNPFGQWTPRLSHDDYPTEKTPSGGKRAVRNIHTVPEDMRMFDLKDLEKFFNPKSSEEPTPEVEADARPGDTTDDFIDLAISRGASIVWREQNIEQISFTPEQLTKFVNYLIDPAYTITALADMIHADNVKAGWWTDLKTGEDLHGKRNVPEMLALVHSEISEALEGHRKKLMDDKLPKRPMLRVELIDAMIRIFDMLGSEGNTEHPAGLIFQEKREYNANRADHKPENRMLAGGKAF